MTVMVRTWVTWVFDGGLPAFLVACTIVSLIRRSGPGIAYLLSLSSRLPGAECQHFMVPSNSNDHPCGFTTILCLGSGQGGGCGFMALNRLLALPPLRGIAAFCRYSCVGNLDVRGALIFECSSLVDRPRCMGFRVYLALFLVQNQA